VIPLYNAEEWIEATIRSVERQTVCDQLDLILVDNGSTDRGFEIARDVLAAGPLRHQAVRAGANRGPSFARNAGWRMSRTPWIQFLDADDLLLPRKIEHQLAVAQTAPPEAAAVHSEWQHYAFDGSRWDAVPPLFSPRIKQDPLRDLMEEDNFLCIPAGLYRRSWLEKVDGFDEECWLIEDVHLQLRLAMAGAAFLDAPAGEPLFYYRRRPASLSTTRAVEFVKGCVRNFRIAERYWAENGLLNSERREFLLAAYEECLHRLAETDGNAFEELLAHVRAFSPRWIPRRPRMRILSRVFGYEAAERMAIQYRHFKKKLTVAP